MTEIKPGTPLPWHAGWENTICYSGEWSEIPLPSGWVESAWIGSNATDESNANAAYIVHTANAHPSLIAGLREAREALAKIDRRTSQHPDDTVGDDRRDKAKANMLARAALAKLDTLLSGGES